MDEKRREAIINLFNGADLSNEEQGYEACRQLEIAVNGGQMKDVLAILDNNGMKVLEMCMCSAFLALAHEYKAAGYSCWDHRKKASEEFASKFQGYFEMTFADLTGFTPEIMDEKMPYYPRAIKERQWLDNGYGYLYGFSRRWGDAHSTNKQSAVRGWVRNVLAARDEAFDHACFPYI